MRTYPHTLSDTDVDDLVDRFQQHHNTATVRILQKMASKDFIAKRECAMCDDLLVGLSVPNVLYEDEIAISFQCVVCQDMVFGCKSI